MRKAAPYLPYPRAVRVCVNSDAFGQDNDLQNGKPMRAFDHPRRESRFLAPECIHVLHGMRRLSHTTRRHRSICHGQASRSAKNKHVNVIFLNFAHPSRVHLVLLSLHIGMQLTRTMQTRMRTHRGVAKEHGLFAEGGHGPKERLFLLPRVLHDLRGFWEVLLHDSPRHRCFRENEGVNQIVARQSCHRISPRQPN